MELDGRDRFVLGLARVGQYLEHLLLPDVDGHGDADAGGAKEAGVLRLADPVRGGGQAVVGDPLHVVARVDDDAAFRGIEADPLHVLAVEYLQAVHPMGGQDGEQVHVLVAQHAAGPGRVVLFGDGRVVVETEAEVRPGELLVVEGRIAAQVGEDALHEGQDQLLVVLDDPPEERFVIGRGPVVSLAIVRVLAQVEGPAAEDPALDEIGMHPAGLLDREVALVDRTVSLGLVLHLVGHGRVREELGHLALGLLVQAGRDLVVLEDHEADALHGLADVPGELRPALRAAVEEEAHVAGPDPRFLVEFLLRRAFGQVVGLFLFYLVVLCVFLVYRLDAVFLPTNYVFRRLCALMAKPRFSSKTNRHNLF